MRHVMYLNLGILSMMAFSAKDLLKFTVLSSRQSSGLSTYSQHFQGPRFSAGTLGGQVVPEPFPLLSSKDEHSHPGSNAPLKMSTKD